MDTNSQIAELVVEVRHLCEDMTELKKEFKEIRDRQNRFENRTTALEEQQKQDHLNFGDLKASLQQTREQSQQEIKDLKSELEPMRSLSQVIANTPGGLKTWAIGGTISLLLSLTAIDISVRAIGVDRLLRHWLIEQTKIEEIVSD